MIEGFDEMSDAERRDALWGLRNGSEPHMNRVRREGFEAVKALITESELPKSVTHPSVPGAQVIQFGRYPTNDEGMVWWSV